MSGSGALPLGWVQAPLGNLVSPRREKVLPQEMPSHLFVGMDNIEPGTMRLLGHVPASSMKSAGCRFYPGDVLYGRLRPYLNKVHLARFEGLCSAEFIVLPPTAGVSAAFVAYRLNAWDFVAFANAANEGDRPRVDFDAIAKFDVWVPPEAEQHHIVAEIEKHLTRIDAGVAALERVQANLKRYRAAVLKAAVEGRLVPTEASLARAEHRDYEPADKLLARILKERRACWTEAGGRGRYEEPVGPDAATLPNLPVGWCWATGDQVSHRITKGSSPKWQGFAYCNDGIPFVRSQNVRWGRLDLADLAFLPSAFNEKETRSILCADDVLLNIVGASIGRAAVADARVAGGNTNQAVAIVRLVQPGLLPRFACLYLISPASQRSIHRAKVDVARANLSLTDIAQIPFPLPPSEEQSRIVAEVERLISLADAADQTILASEAHAGRLRQSTFKRAFEGRLVPQDPNDEPASALLERIRASHPTNGGARPRGRSPRRGSRARTQAPC